MSSVTSNLEVSDSAIGARTAPDLLIHRLTTPARALIPTASALLYFCVAIVLQWYGAAYTSELAGYPDEPAHYVTGLMVRDYVAQHHLVAPLPFAENYYVHYPKVGLGHWPPVFYVIEAVWMLLFSASRTSVLVLMAFMTALLGLTVLLAVRREYGIFVGAAAGMLCIALPLVQQSTGMVMAEIPLTLLCLWAVLTYGKFLETEKVSDALTFGLLSGLAILTKGNAFALALLPLFALLLTRRWQLLKRPAFWIPALIVAAVAGPWYWYTRGMLQGAWEQPLPSLRYAWVAVGFYVGRSVAIAGTLLAAVIVVGIWAKLVRPTTRTQIQGTWVAAGAWIASAVTFYCCVPTGIEARFLVLLAPVLVMFLFAGAATISELLPLKQVDSRRRMVAVAAIATIFATQGFSVPQKSVQGYSDAVRFILGRPEFSKSVMLVASDAEGEGSLIADVAMQEEGTRPGHIVLRSSKTLCEENWLGSDGRALFKAPPEMENFLEEIPVGLLVIDRFTPRGACDESFQILNETTRIYSPRWERLAAFPITRNGISYPSALQVYRLRNHQNMPLGTIRVNVRAMLNKTLELKGGDRN